MEEEQAGGHCDGCSRRTFLQAFGLAASGILLHPRGAWAEAPEVVIPLEKLPGLDKAGAGLRVRLKDREVLLIRLTETEIAALDPACRHKKCGVKFESGWDAIKCKCHGSRYDFRGKVLNGPATKDLIRFPAEISGGALKVTLT